MSIVAYSAELESELETSRQLSVEQSRHIKMLRSELAGLRQSLERSQASAKRSRQEAKQLAGLLLESERRLSQLSESYETIEREHRLRETTLIEQRNNEAARGDTWRMAGIAAAVLAVIGWIAALV